MKNLIFSIVIILVFTKCEPKGLKTLNIVIDKQPQIITLVDPDWSPNSFEIYFTGYTKSKICISPRYPKYSKNYGNDTIEGIFTDSLVWRSDSFDDTIFLFIEPIGGAEGKMRIDYRIY
jgi:hypothetical protein